MPPYKLYVVLITEARFRPDISFPRNKSETPQDVLRQLLLQVEVSSICSEYYWLTKVKSLKPKNRNNYHDDRVHFRKVKFQITLHLCQNIKPSVNVLVQCFGYFMRNFFPDQFLFSSLNSFEKSASKNMFKGTITALPPNFASNVKWILGN